MGTPKSGDDFNGFSSCADPHNPPGGKTFTLLAKHVHTENSTGKAQALLLRRLLFTRLRKHIHIRRHAGARKTVSKRASLNLNNNSTSMLETPIPELCMRGSAPRARQSPSCAQPRTVAHRFSAGILITSQQNSGNRGRLGGFPASGK